MGNKGFDNPLPKNKDSKREDFPQLFFPKKRFIRLKPSMNAYRMPRNRSILALLNIIMSLILKIVR